MIVTETRKNHGILFALVLCAQILILSSHSLAFEARTPFSIEIKAKAAKRNHILGEPVRIRISIKNRGKRTFQVPYTHWTQISGDGKKFVTYAGPGRGYSLDGIDAIATVKPGKVFKSEGTILWNRIPEGTHRNPKVAREQGEGSLLRHFAFERAGIYWIRIRYPYSLGPNRRGVQPWRWAETKPIKVKIRHAQGNDLLVWKQMYKYPEIAFFLQSSRFSSSKKKERKNIERLAEEMIQNYPNLVVIKELKRSLNLFRKREANLKILMRNRIFPRSSF